MSTPLPMDISWLETRHYLATIIRVYGLFVTRNSCNLQIDPARLFPTRPGRNHQPPGGQPLQPVTWRPARESGRLKLLRTKEETQYPFFCHYFCDNIIIYSLNILIFLYFIVDVNIIQHISIRKSPNVFNYINTKVVAGFGFTNQPNDMTYNYF